MIVVALNEKRELYLVRVPDNYCLCAVIGSYFPDNLVESIGVYLDSKYM